MKKRTITFVSISLFVFGTAFIQGCEEKGPAEEAGEQIDEAVEEAGDAIEDATDG